MRKYAWFFFLFIFFKRFLADLKNNHFDMLITTKKN